ncbi:MAG: FixH family protein [Sulfurospirillum sp.]|nr:FixH family protein [Sulfurospirillum sp.]
MKKFSAILLGLGLLSSVALVGADMDHSKMQMNIAQSSSTTQSGAYTNMTQKDGYSVMMSSQKPLIAGSNKLHVKIQKDTKAITDAQARIKFFMPEMPGMPAMEYKANGVLIGDTFQFDISLGMGGTWQYQLQFKTSDGVVHKTKGSVNI